MNIRYGTKDDAKLLSELGARTFQSAFAEDTAPANMKSYLKRSFSTKIQLKELSDPDVIFLIAESEHVPAGYAQLVKNSRDPLITGGRPLEIRRIYVLQDYIGKGVGKELMNAAFNEASYLGCDCIWLGVWEKNDRAIEFYNKWGFHEVGSHTFVLGDDPQTDLVMVYDLSYG